MSPFTDGIEAPVALEDTQAASCVSSSAVDVPAGMAADPSAVSAAAALPSRPWDRFAAELADTLATMPKARPLVRCVYCGAKTRAVSQVCPAHSDLPRFDPHMNVQAGRFTR